MRLLALALLLAACGPKPAPTPPPTDPPTTDPPPPSAASNEDRAKAAVEALSKICKSRKLEAMIPLLVYKGDEDLAGKWRRPMTESDAGAGDRVMDVCQTVPPPHDLGFGSFEQETESEGTWLSIEVATGLGGHAAFSFLDINGQLLLGDID